MTGAKRGTVVPFRLRSDKAQTIIREIAQDTSRVILGDHARQRSEERDISDIEIYRGLQRGHVLDEPTLTSRREWKCKVQYQTKGTRDIGIVTVILTSGRLFVKTVEWEDWR